MHSSRFALVAVAATCLVSCAKDGIDVINEPKDGGQVVTYNTVGDIADKTHGRQVFFAYGAVAGASKLPANGVASLMVFEDGTTNIGVQLNVEMAAKGNFYEVWLSSANDEKSAWKSLGHAKSVVGDVRHALKTSLPEDLKERLQIAVTLESDDGNAAPSDTLIARATLKQVIR